MVSYTENIFIEVMMLLVESPNKGHFETSHSVYCI